MFTWRRMLKSRKCFWIETLELFIFFFSFFDNLCWSIHGFGLHHLQRFHRPLSHKNGSLTGVRYIDEILAPIVKLYAGRQCQTPSCKSDQLVFVKGNSRKNGLGSKITRPQYNRACMVHPPETKFTKKTPTKNSPLF